MKVTVADCLELDAFAKAKVVAAKVNLTNEVKSISVLDACTTSQPVDMRRWQSTTAVDCRQN